MRKGSGAAAGSVVSASGVAMRRPRSCWTRRCGAEAQLFGRRTYEFLAARWPSRSGELADRLNDMPKYVVSSTLKDPDWNNSTVLAGDVMQEVSKLKEERDGEIVVAGSIRLVRTLMENDLVDELRLMIYPVVLGAGERLFGETSDQRPVRLVETRTVDDLAYLTYRVRLKRLPWRTRRRMGLGASGDIRGALRPLRRCCRRAAPPQARLTFALTAIAGGYCSAVGVALAPADERRLVTTGCELAWRSREKGDPSVRLRCLSVPPRRGRPRGGAAGLVAGGRPHRTTASSFDLVRAACARREFDQLQDDDALRKRRTVRNVALDGAIYWSGVGRVVYALSSAELLAAIVDDASRESAIGTARAATCSLAGGRPIDVGRAPAHLIEGATAVHEGYWK